MTKESMPKPETGVYRIARSTSWQWRIKVPKDLRHEYPSEWAHRTSLNTPDLRVANTAAATFRAEWLTRFEQQRQGQTLTTIEAFTPELTEKLVALRLHLSLRGDERRRNDPGVYGPIVRDFKRHGVLPGTTPEADPKGLDGVPRELSAYFTSFDAEVAKVVLPFLAGAAFMGFGLAGGLALVLALR